MQMPRATLPPELVNGLDETQCEDLRVVARAFLGALIAGEDRLGAWRAGRAAYRALRPNEVDEAIDIAVGAMISRVETWIGSI